ncbi:glycosyltransferase family 2 protein [Agromyces sp. Leaf222]|uniref:glycosyltransferase family 2 protein n=1 Tax=Agromyces sp. Leaf222 TaxID=1735688 RepID=UPI00138EF5A8|nr:glycosyltransferase family 2 protein [Agromyces sp. Leaf222]
MNSLTGRLRALTGRAITPLRTLTRPALLRIRGARGRALAASVPPNERETGWISVIMPTKDVVGYLDESLRSVLSQGYWRVEVVVVDDASTDGTRERIAEWERRDSRVRVFDVDVSDPNAARNFALRRTTGEFLAFLDGDDVLLAGAYRDLVESIRRTGSDFAVAGYERRVGRRTRPAAFWIDEAHANRLDRTTLAEHPAIMVNAVQWSKVYRREFWDRAGLRFPEGGHFQDQVVSAEGYSRATAFDVLTRRAVAWRIRQDGSSMTQQGVVPRQIADRFSTSIRALEVLRRDAGPEVERRRLIQYLSNDIAIAAASLPDMGGEAFDALRSGLERLAPSIERRDVWDDVPAESKVLYALILAGDEARARAYIEQGGLDLLRHRLVGIGGAAFVALPFWGDADAAVELERFRAAPRELRAFAHELGVDAVPALRESARDDGSHRSTGAERAPEGSWSGGARDEALVD